LFPIRRAGFKVTDEGAPVNAANVFYTKLTTETWKAQRNALNLRKL
jgi:hypothetical protein